MIIKKSNKIKIRICVVFRNYTEVFPRPVSFQVSQNGIKILSHNHTLIPNSNLQCIYDIFIFVAQVENCFTEINFPAGFFTVMQLHTLKRRLLTGST